MPPTLLLTLLLLLNIGNPGAPVSSTPVASPPAHGSCPVTIPDDERPAPGKNPFDHDASLVRGNGLWVEIPADGILELAPESAITFGPLTGWRSTSTRWLRDEGVQGFIEVTGKRLDQPSELRPQTPLSPQRQYVRTGPVTTGLAFPTAGCWEVTATAGTSSVTWVMGVRFAVTAASTPA